MEINAWWRHGAIITIIIGITGLMFMGRQTYNNAPPIFKQVEDSAGRVIYTGKDILAGQAVFQRYGLMDYGSVFGHGAYRGPDFTADYLHRSSMLARDTYAIKGFNKNYEALDPEQKAEIDQRVTSEIKTNRYDAASGVLHASQVEVESFSKLVLHYQDFFTNPGADAPLPKNYIADVNDIRSLTAFFAWTAWAASTPRPGKDYSYTNNWPPDKDAGNRPSVAVFLWSALSIISLFGALGLVLMFFGRFDYLGWGHGKVSEIKLPPIGGWPLTASQKATYKFFVVVSLLFLFQTFMGVVTAHYFVEGAGFYGIDIRSIFPTTITRSWHLQLSIFWIATAWLATGIFVGPMLSEKEPKWQSLLVNVLFTAVVIVAVGSIFGEWLGIKNMLGNLWFWLGHQGWEYLELGRLWQILLTAGMAIWAFIVFRAIRPTLKNQDPGSMPYLLLYSIIAIPLMYSFGMMYKPSTNFVIADFWRWWIVHLWVEGFFELFTTIVVANFFVILGLVTSRSALRVVYLDILLYLGSGMIGTAHHYYWTAQPAINLALGSFFSAMEVVPLFLLTLEAWDFIRLHQDKSVLGVDPKEFPHKWTVMFLMAVGFWNFLGAGVFGFLINLPIVSYYEHATYLTSNHGHGALMGVYGNLAIAALAFCSRYIVDPQKWNDRLWAISFWSINLGLLFMLVFSIFPVGIFQMIQSYLHGFWFARSSATINAQFFQVFTWARVLGDVVFVLGGTVPIAYFMVTRWFSMRPVKNYQNAGR
ncbi:MAG: cbb3-type cytochrome c oxidase subunit I [Candidatus Omnitrophica bacterium]|nr:cbb3-type cytochrome c oxidase subunit I [Candidatus Omnitrophota bacterium]